MSSSARISVSLGRGGSQPKSLPEPSAKPSAKDDWPTDGKIPERGKKWVKEPRECPLHGGYVAMRVAGVWSGCPRCREDRMSAQMGGVVAALKGRAMGRAVDASGIPDRFRGCTVESYRANPGSGPQQFAKEVANDLARRCAVPATPDSPGCSAIFCGRPGTGKTHLACAIGMAALAAGRSVVYVTTLRMIRRIKASWGGEGRGEGEEGAIDAFVRPDVLILDEVGAQFGSETEKLLLFDVLNARYERRKSVLLLSNLEVAGVRAHLGERVFDRLREDGGRYVPFTWESHRGSI